MSSNTTKTWKEKQQRYKIGAVLFFIFLILIFVPLGSGSSNELAELKNRTVESIEYRSYGSKPTKKEIRVKFLGTMGKFCVSGSDYDTFNHSDFKKEVKKGDKISIKIRKGSRDYIARSLSKNGKEYFNFRASEDVRGRNRIRMIILTGYGFIFCLIPLFIEKQPLYDYEMLLIIGFFLCFLLIMIFVN